MQRSPTIVQAQPTTDSRYAWTRLGVTLALMTIGGVAACTSVPVVLPAVQAEFGVARADASLPYTLLMIGFGVGGIADGTPRRPLRRDGAAPDRRGRARARASSSPGCAGSIWAFTLAHGVLIGLLGSSATFAPLIADTSLWFVRRRGIAVAICASGNYLAGAIWPPIVQHFVETRRLAPDLLRHGRVLRRRR